MPPRQKTIEDYFKTTYQMGGHSDLVSTVRLANARSITISIGTSSF